MSEVEELLITLDAHERGLKSVGYNSIAANVARAAALLRTQQQRIEDLEKGLKAADALAIGPNGSGGMKITINFANVDDAFALFNALSAISSPRSAEG